MIHLILLSGGSGTRLWPLSNETRSKQFLKVLRDGKNQPISMVQRTFEMIKNMPAEVDITIATCASQKESIQRQVTGGYSLVLEPERRDTAPAIMLACAHLASVQNANVDDTVIVMPIDTFADQNYYNKVCDLDSAVQSGFADLVLLGVEPTYPSEKYGYILPRKKEDSVWMVSEFREKPTEALAAELISRGGLWNCGVFAFRLGYVGSITASYGIHNSFDELQAHYTDLPKLSFDYEVVEKASSVAVVPFSGEWKDLGTWNTLSEEMAETSAGRAILDETTCRNVHVINETGLPLVVAGLVDSVVVATPDGILVSEKTASANIKKQVALASESRPMYEQRRWGEYRVLDSSVYSDGKKALTKELLIRPGHQLSYQVHTCRNEVWTIVSGTGEVVVGETVIPVKAGSVVSVDAGKKHSARAFESLHIIEVQLGDILVEEDIQRFGNYWK